MCLGVCLWVEVVSSRTSPPTTHPRWTGGMAADKLRRASVTDHDCTCSPEGARSVCLWSACVCVLLCFLIYSPTAIWPSWPPPPARALPSPPHTLSQSGWLNIWTAQMRESPLRLSRMFSKYLVTSQLPVDQTAAVRGERISNFGSGWTNCASDI